MDQNELDIVRRALIKYAGGNPELFDHPPHSPVCSWVIYANQAEPATCNCGVQEIIDNWKPDPPEPEYPGRCLKCQKKVRWDRLTSKDDGLPYGPYYLFDDTGCALCKAYDGRVHHSVNQDFPVRPMSTS